MESIKNFQIYHTPRAPCLSLVSYLSRDKRANDHDLFIANSLSKEIYMNEQQRTRRIRDSLLADEGETFIYSDHI